MSASDPLIDTTPPARLAAAAALLALAALAGCSTQQQAPLAEIREVKVPLRVPVIEPTDAAAREFLAYSDRLRQLSGAELQQEVTRLGDGSASPLAAIQLALALGQTRASGDIARAQALLDSIQRTPAPEYEPWQALARFLSMRYADQRRLEDQVERQAQQMRDNQRDNQRRVDQLNEKLEALKAIERSIGSRTPPASAPGEKPAK